MKTEENGALQVTDMSMEKRNLSQVLILLILEIFSHEAVAVCNL